MRESKEKVYLFEQLHNYIKAKSFETNGIWSFARNHTKLFSISKFTNFLLVLLVLL